MPKKIKLLSIFGTRPEAIKMAPLLTRLAQEDRFESKICVTAQHREMLDAVLTLFQLRPDFDLNIMQSGQELTEMTARILLALDGVFQQYRPDFVLLHGDTTSTFATAIACYYQQIPIIHIEAGLRTHQLNSPFPEEGNRCLTAVLARYHFAPSEQAKQNLLKEGKDASRIWVTGNTVIDALTQTLQKINQNQPLTHALQQRYAFLEPSKKLIVVTSHRRETVGAGIERICAALKQLALEHSDIQIVYPLHLNPQITQPVKTQLADIRNLYLIEAQDYLAFIYLMNKAYLVLTDSGGIQEEAPALGKPVLVLREQSERTEAIATGNIKLVGTDPTTIVDEVNLLLTDPAHYQTMCQIHSPYGDGNAAARIVETLKELCL